MGVVRVSGADAPASLLPLLESAGDLGKSVTFVSPGSPETVPWSQVHDDARAAAALLQSRGVGPGTQVAVVAHTSRATVTAIQAIWLAGAAALVLPLRTRLTKPEEHAAQTEARVRLADCIEVLVDAEHRGGLELPSSDLDGLMAEAARTPGDRYDPPMPDPSATAVLQFTSGSTADPKAVVVPHNGVVSNLMAFSHRLDVDPDTDVFVTWLPLYHDMGLFETMTMPMMLGCELVLAATRDFLTGPAHWMEWMTAYRGTFTMGPNVSFAMVARLLAKADGIDLSACRAVGNGSEMIDPAVVEGFLAAGGAKGMAPGADFAAYGLAEATLAVTATRPGDGMWFDAVDGAALENERQALVVPADHADARRLASCGPPLPGFDVRIVGDDGQPVAERRLGEVQARGPSITPGYFRRPDATEALFQDGWLRTGDLGYLVGDELVLVGRTKDLIIVSGRNIFPEDVEVAAATVSGVRAGNVIAFSATGARGREMVVVVAEARADADGGSVRDGVARAVREAVGVQPHDVVLIQAGALPKTTSGKLQRSRCRAQYLDGTLATL